MKQSRVDAQLYLPATEVRRSERAPAAVGDSAATDSAPAIASVPFRNSEHDSDAFRKSEQLAVSLFNEAVENTWIDRERITNKEIAHLCGVSPSMVEKWRSAEARGCPSFVQLLRLPPAFHLELHRAMNRRFGFGRQLLARILDDLGALALAVGE